MRILARKWLEFSIVPNSSSISHPRLNPDAAVVCERTGQSTGVASGVSSVPASVWHSHSWAENGKDRLAHTHSHSSSSKSFSANPAHTNIRNLPRLVRHQAGAAATAAAAAEPATTTSESVKEPVQQQSRLTTKTTTSERIDPLMGPATSTAQIPQSLLAKIVRCCRCC